MLNALMLATAMPQSAALMPTGPWQVRADEDRCRLERTYIQGEGKLTIGFEPSLVNEHVDLLVLTEDASTRSYAGNFALTISPGARHFVGHYDSLKLAGQNSRVTRVFIDMPALFGLKDGDVLHVEATPITYDLTITHPDKARDALNGCIADLKKSWGVQPLVNGQVPPTLAGNPAVWFGADAYPSDAFRQHIQGRVITVLTVGDDGAVKHCRVVVSPNPALDDGTCKAAAHIRFLPARGPDGTALASTYIMPVRWTLPKP